MHSTSRDASTTAINACSGCRTCNKILIPLRRCMQVKTNDKERVKRKRPSVRVKSTSLTSPHSYTVTKKKGDFIG